MNTTMQRIAIAEFCGYENQGNGVFKQRGEDDDLVNTEDLPDYLNDINETNRAVASYLPERKHGAYVVMLARVIAGTAGKGGRAQGIRINVPQFVLIHAPARARAEALLRVIGKWEDS